MAKLREALQSNLGGTYHVHEELGGGGMSATFIAEEVARRRSVVGAERALQGVAQLHRPWGEGLVERGVAKVRPVA